VGHHVVMDPQAPPGLPEDHEASRRSDRGGDLPGSCRPGLDRAQEVGGAALELVSRTAWTAHLRDYAAALASRSRALLAAVATDLPAVNLPARPYGGMHLWAHLPAGVDDVETALVARPSPGWSCSRTGPFWPGKAPAAHLRLTFSAVPFEADLDVAMRRPAMAVPELT
jgi:DNA-binding transcriptional MocR family regulator